MFTLSVYGKKTFNYHSNYEHIWMRFLQNSKSAYYFSETIIFRFLKTAFIFTFAFSRAKILRIYSSYNIIYELSKIQLVT